MVAFGIPNPTGKLQTVDWSREKENWSHLSSLDISPPFNLPINLIIGADNVDLLAGGEVMGPSQGDPIAKIHPIGVTVAGITKKGAAKASTHSMSGFSYQFRVSRVREAAQCGIQKIHEELGKSSSVFPMCPVKISPNVFKAEKVEQTPEESSMKEVERIVKQQWEIEKPIAQPKWTKDEVLAKQIMDESFKLVNGRPMVRIPWKPGEPCFPDGRAQAVKRLYNFQKSTKFDQLAKEVYAAKLKEQLEKGYLRVVSREEPREGQKFYIPMFPKVRESSTTPVRPVLAANAKHQLGRSLNQAIFPGPNLANPLIKVLTRFRKNPVAEPCFNVCL